LSILVGGLVLLVFGGGVVCGGVGGGWAFVLWLLGGGGGFGFVFGVFGLGGIRIKYELAVLCSRRIFLEFFRFLLYVFLYFSL